MIKFFLWLRRIFSFRIQGHFKMNDKVIWDTSQEEGIALSKEFGKGPFRVAGFKENKETLLLSDSSGMILSDKHFHPKQVNAVLVKLK